MNYCTECGTRLETVEREDRERNYCGECNSIVYRNPKPVAWLLVEHSGENLMVKRDHEPDRGKWDIPGGFVELEESFEEAARRELREETGVRLEKQIQPVDTINFQRLNEHVVGIVFHAELEDRPEIEAGEEAMEARFWILEELKQGGEELREECSRILVDFTDR